MTGHYPVSDRIVTLLLFHIRYNEKKACETCRIDKVVVRELCSNETQILTVSSVLGAVVQPSEGSFIS